MGQLQLSTFSTYCVQGVPKKMSFSGKTAITTFKLIQNAKAGGVLENSGYLLPDGHWDFQNWRRNDWENEAWSCQPPLQKSAEFTTHIMHSFDDPLHFHDWIFQNTPYLCILDEFEGSYGYFSKKQHFFLDTL